MSRKKTCSRCQKAKLLKFFYKNASRNDGLQTYCKSCQTKTVRKHQRENPEANYKRVAAWRKRNPEKVRAARQRSHHKLRLKRYGLTEIDYAEIVNKFDGKCHICRKLPDTPVLDHCHGTGKVRGLLCPACNMGLGTFGDDPDRLEEAAKYLRG